MTISCPNGHTNPPGSTFCGRCGSAITSAATPTQQSTGEPTAPTGVVSVTGAAATTVPGRAPSVAWIATHRVPPEGLDVRGEPAPQLPAVTRLPAGTQLQVQEWKQAWARVTIASGWGGWVDGRRLVDVNAPAPVQPQPQAWAQPGPTVVPATGWVAPYAAAAPSPGIGAGPGITMIGAAAAIGSTFLPWVGFAGVGVNAWDSPFAYLWSTTAGPSGFTVGLAVVILAGIALLVAGFMATSGIVRGAAGMVSFAGGLYLAVTLAYIFQTVRTGLDIGISLGDIVTDWFGIGIWVAFGGAIVITIGARLRPR